MLFVLACQSDYFVGVYVGDGGRPERAWNDNIHMACRVRQ